MIYAATESISSELSIMFGIVGWELRKKTLIATPLVEGMRLMSTKLGAPNFGFFGAASGAS